MKRVLFSAVLLLAFSISGAPIIESGPAVQSETAGVACQASLVMGSLLPPSPIETIIETRAYCPEVISLCTLNEETACYFSGCSGCVRLYCVPTCMPCP